ncbi:MAG: hypothetical protein GKR88_15625 [Flavobacteriaceae bacterium]|nr:MAG: hypothetical protein GKR88_15625 [Flavobacteriaceae bacterium]
MVKLSIQEILEKIHAAQLFEAVVEDYSFTIKIEEYVPYVCAAIHDGHQFRKELWSHCKHTEYERWYEEDPATKEMIKTHPIVISGMDSRFEYDLNRAPENAIYEDAWGKQLWYTPLSNKMKEKSLAKHIRFYEVVHTLISKIEHIFGVCVVYDMHSYNWKRWNREVPVWNLGTANVDKHRFEEDIESWCIILGKMHLPNTIKSTARINDTFQGNGYFLRYIGKSFNNTLVLATEIAKIYCDELAQILYPEVIDVVEKYLKTELKKHATAFYERHKG